MTKSFYEQIFEATQEERLEAFEKLGIPLMDAKGEYRNIVDIFEELAEKWQMLTKEERGV